MENINQKKIQQRALDKAYKHIIKQGAPSRAALGRCRYRNENGLGCAFAPMIKEYSPTLEGRAAGNVVEYYSRNLFKWARDLNISFAFDLQRCHDRVAVANPENFIRDFKVEIAKLAEKYGLEMPE